MYSQAGLNCRSAQEQGMRGGVFSGIKWSGYEVFWLIGLLQPTSYWRQCHIYINLKCCPILELSSEVRFHSLTLIGIDLFNSLHDCHEETSKSYSVAKQWENTPSSCTERTESQLLLWLCWGFSPLLFCFFFILSRFSGTTESQRLVLM